MATSDYQMLGPNNLYLHPRSFKGVSFKQRLCKVFCKNLDATTWLDTGDLVERKDSHLRSLRHSVPKLDNGSHHYAHLCRLVDCRGNFWRQSMDIVGNRFAVVLQ